MNSFFAELKRRNVVRVGVAYVIVSWAILQFVDIIEPILGLPEWFPKVAFTLLLIGLPIALLLSWAYEVTPEGVKKTEEVDQSKSITHGTGQKINKLIIGALVLAVGFLLYDKFILTSEPPAETIEIAEAQAGTSIAVLPFVNMSNDPDQEYFSDGISEEILNVLVRVDGLSVASRTSSFAFKGRNPNIPEIAETLNVDHILEGSVRKQGNRVRITAQLIDVKTDRHLWSETYDRELTDIFEIQDEISNAIVTALKDTLGLETLEAVSVQAMTENMSAYDLYLKGRGLFIYRIDLPLSASLLEQAVALDEKFAAAWETLAATYAVMPSWGFRDRPYSDLSNQAVDKAISLDSTLSLAYAVKGNNLAINDMQNGAPPNWKQSFKYLDQAIENNPKNATAYLWRALNYLFLGFFDKALADFDACLKIDPAYGNCERHKGSALVVSGQIGAGLALYTEGVEKGFPVFGGAGAFAPAMVKEGNELAALLYWRTSEGFENFPAAAWIKAFKNPGGDHREGWAKVQKWAVENDMDLTSGRQDILLVFGQYEKITPVPSYSYFIWWPEAHEFRQTGNFKRIAAGRNYPAYWFEFGFPPFCRPLGDDDYECD
ncbi:MAG: hypothetical protein IH995_04535 [Proteobacteria bacterium]|nr:hypothetical protein [Pseudomonadota bacterium]